MTGRPPSRLYDFVKLHPEAEAVLQHVGRDTWDLLLVDVGGTWEREEFKTPAEAEDACRQLGVRLHHGWDDPRMARRMNARDHWNTPDGQRRGL